MAFLNEMDEAGLISKDMPTSKGQELHETYRSGKPYPHIVIDDFLPPAILDRCLAEFPAPQAVAEESFDRAQERLKESFHPDTLPPHARILFYSFNSRPFLRLIENITGIRGLVPDPYFLGAGYHRVSTGGHLSIHADFNHHKPMNLERRINVLIYLNKGWDEAYGGSFEMWDKDMTRCEKSVLPSFNRCVIFNTTAESMHGNPQPVNHPDGVPRRSIALYYYTSTWEDTKKEYTTQFRVRPNSGDSVDWQVRLRELARDITPPLLFRGLKRIRKESDTVARP